MKSQKLAAVLVAVCALADVLAAQDEAPRILGRVLGVSGTPIGGAQVHGPGGVTKSDAAGQFALPVNPASEDEMLVVRADGYALFHQTLAPNAHESEILVRLRSPKVAVVRVIGEDGKPVRGATVRARLPFAPAYSVLERTDFLAVTDQDGLAVVKDIPGDCALVAEVRAPGMIPAQSPPLAPIPAPSAAELAAVAETITVTPGRMLKIAVEDPSGRPVPRASINLLPLSEPRLDFGGQASRDTTRGAIRSGQTDASGAISFDFLPANPITCEVRAIGMLTQLLVVEGVKGAGKLTRIRLRPDPNPPAADIPWRLSVAAASDEAKRTGLPIFLVMTMDGEKANDWMASHHYHDPEVVRAAREVVPIVSSAFGEGGIGDSDHVEKDGKCTRYGSIPCHVHQEIEKLAREALMATRMVFEVPRHIATTPAGDRIFERVFFLSERDLLRLIVRALRVTAPDNAMRLARERLAAVVEELGHADVAVRKKGVRALTLLANSGDEHAAALVQGLASLNVPAATRAHIAEELHPCALTAPLSTLADLIGDSDREVRRAFFGRVAEVVDDEAILDRLASELRNTDGHARDALLRALDVERRADELWVHVPVDGNRWRLLEELIEMPDAGRVQGLDDVLRDVQPAARYRLLRALGRRAGGDSAAQDVLVRAVKGASPVAAVRALSKAALSLKPPNLPLRTLVEAARSTDALVREEALRALASSTVPVDPEVLAAGLTHPATPVRIQAALALWRRGDRSGQSVLLAATKDPEFGSEVRAVLRN